DLENKLLGRVECATIMVGSAWNEAGKGLASIDGYAAYCSQPTCPGAFLAASALPWSGELVEGHELTGPAQPRLQIKNVSLTLGLPCRGVEATFTGDLELSVFNGTAIGLHPSHLAFSNEGDRLISGALPSAEEANVANELGELATLGTNLQLMTATE